MTNERYEQAIATLARRRKRQAMHERVRFARQSNPPTDTDLAIRREFLEEDGALMLAIRILGEQIEI